MIRTFAAAGGLCLAVLVPMGLAGAAAAQTWGQPVYVTPYGGGVGGTPLSEVETRAYVNTGRWADGYVDQVYVHAPAAVRYGYGYRRKGYGHSHGYEPSPRRGYRDVWGYNDDRPPPARGWARDRHARGRDGDCGCGDVYLYDR